MAASTSAPSERSFGGCMIKPYIALDVGVGIIAAMA
jgi:hypothetical protein